MIADALDKLTAAGARGVGLDIIFAEPSNPEEDQRLAASIARSGRVVLPAQLYETISEENATTAAPVVKWLRPLPMIAREAWAVGHAHVAPGVEIHANIIYTIRGRLSLQPLPEGMAFLSALAVILCAMLTVPWFDGWRQVGLLALLLLAILAGSFLAFSRYQIIPPLVPMLTGFGVIDRILSSMGEGVLVSDLSGRILFANQEAMRIFGCRENEVIGAWFDQFLIEPGHLDSASARDAIEGALSGRAAQLEFEISRGEPQYYSLLLSALVARPDTAIGVVALISDISWRVEVDRLKTETLQLVSHELRTPLTSIRGLSDVLLKFPVAEEQSREMIDTIHAESVRLGEMLNRYLDSPGSNPARRPCSLRPSRVAG